MSSFNKVILLGNLTRDVEVGYTPKGTAIGRMGLAVNRKWRGGDGEMREEVCFVDVDSFGKQAETIAQYVGKGSSILIEGRLHLSQWEDKETGQKRSKLSVICENFQFAGRKASEDDGSGQVSSGQEKRGKSSPKRENDAPSEEPEDDIPF